MLPTKFTTMLAHRLSFDRTAVDSEVSQVSQELLGTVLALHQLEEVWRVINEL